MAKDFFCKDCDLYKTSCSGTEGQYKLNCIEGVGPRDAKIMIIGMCPGADECETKEPFTGESGIKLNDCLKAAGLKREEVFITNLVRCRPPRVKKSGGGYEDKEPLVSHIKACNQYLDKDIAEIEPRVLVMLGNTVTKAIIGKSGIKQIHGHSYWHEDYGTTCIPCYHPSYLIRRIENVTSEIEFVNDLKFAKLAAETKEFTPKPKIKTQYFVADTFKKVKNLINRLKELTDFVNDIETTGLNPDSSKLLCTAFSWKEGTGACIPIRRWFKYFSPTITGLGEPIYEEAKISKKKEKEIIQYIQLEEGQELKEKKTYTYTPVGEMIYKLEEFWKPEELKYIKENLIPILENPDVTKTGHNYAFDVNFTNIEWDIDIKGANYDTMHGDYLPNPDKTANRALEDLTWLHTDMGGYDEGLKKERKNGFKNTDPFELYNYACADCDATGRIKESQTEEMKDFMWVMENIQVPLSLAIREMEYNGVKIDLEQVSILSKKYEDNILKCETKLYSLPDVKTYSEEAEAQQKQEIKDKWINSKRIKTAYSLEEYIQKNLKRFNFGSVVQLRELLFNRLGLETKKKTPTGLASTDEKTLEELRGQHEVVDNLLELRHLNKIYSTYLKPIPNQIDTNGRLHTSYRLDRTKTGRLASSKPNLQNIPKKKDGNEIRDYFVASDGHVMVESDLKQIEYRILAHFVNDEKMLKDIADGLDIHNLISTLIYNIPEDQVTEEQRDKSKAVTFGVPYGRSSMSIAAEYGMSIAEAEDFKNALLTRYPKVKKWIGRMIEVAGKKGYVKNHFGRIRYLPKMNDPKDRIREAEERKVVATAVQGTASDVLSLYTINIHKRLKEMKSKTKLILTVHDAIFFDIPDEEVKKVIPIIKEEMERAIDGIRVKIETGIKVGKKWGSLVKYEKGALV